MAIRDVEVTFEIVTVCSVQPPPFEPALTVWMVDWLVAVIQLYESLLVVPSSSSMMTF